MAPIIIFGRYVTVGTMTRVRSRGGTEVEVRGGVRRGRGRGRRSEVREADGHPWRLQDDALLGPQKVRSE